MVDPLSKDVLAKIKHILKLTPGIIKFCNGTENSKVHVIEEINLENKRIKFLIDDIVNHIFVKMKKIPVQLLIFAKHGLHCSISLRQVLIYMTAINFEPGTYIFSNKTYNTNLSISQPFNSRNIYISNDGQSDSWNLLKFPFYILYFYTIGKIWKFTGKVFEANSFYQFGHSTIPKYISNPLLISANNPLTDILKAYFLERAWYRKILFICSSCVITSIALFMSSSKDFINTEQVLLVSGIYNAQLLGLFVIECSMKCIYKSTKLLPDPFEAFELYIFISPIPLCIIGSFIIWYDRNKSRFVIIEKMARHIYAYKEARFILSMLILMYVERDLTISCWFTDVLVMLAIVNVAAPYVSNIIHWPLRYFLCCMYFSSIHFMISLFLQMFVNLYQQYAEWISSVQIWIPLIFLFMSYLRDVLNEYSRVFKHCLESAFSLIQSNKCIEIKNVAILAGGRADPRSDWTNGNNEIFSKVMIFYQNGVPHVTSKFFYEIRDLLDQVLGSSLSIKLILLKELKSICFRIFPIFITILVINTSNLCLDKFEPVQKVLIGSVLFQLYSRVFLQRESPNINISTNPYFKSRLNHLIKQRNEEFYITPSSKQDVHFHVIPKGIFIVTIVTFIFLIYIKSHSSTVFLSQLFDGFRRSSISQLIYSVCFIIFMFHLVLKSNSF